MQWIINADQPFRGYTLSYLNPDGTVAYTDGLTVEEYAARKGITCRVIDDDTLDDLVREHHKSLITKPRRIPSERWWDMLEILPPCRWHVVGSFEVFHVSERLTGNLVSWFANRGSDYFEFVDRDNLTDDEIALKLEGK
tara:strand:- start:7581 stop:7997 length:417 start_codon:yes stop_codon:yes gene_type:complete